MLHKSLRIFGIHKGFIARFKIYKNSIFGKLNFKSTCTAYITKTKGANTRCIKKNNSLSMHRELYLFNCFFYLESLGFLILFAGKGHIQRTIYFALYAANKLPVKIHANILPDLVLLI